MKCPLIAIVGPTASGKSVLAELVAKELSTEIISVDAMQIYRGMDIGTAKLPTGDRRIPLHMVDVANPSENFSVKRFQELGRLTIDKLLLTHNTAVLCGGTGLYLNALIDDMSFPKGEYDSSYRTELNHLAETKGALYLHMQLQELDPKSAEIIHPNNVRRVIRALELLQEGRSYASLHAHLHERAVQYPCQIWALKRERALLYEHINQRVDKMFVDGLLEEVARLKANGLSAKSTAGQAIGYKELLAYFAGEVSYDEAKDTIKQRTRRYAKRQLSWFGRDPRVRWLDMDNTSPKDAATQIVYAWQHLVGSALASE